MAAETGPQEQGSRVPRWVKIVAAAVLVGVIGVIVYGYLARPGWIGVSGKKFWDYLELLIVPAALALGAYLLNRAQQEQALEVENQRAQDAALQAYLDQLTQLLVTQRDDRLLRMSIDDDVRQVIQARSEPLLRSLDSTRRWRLTLFLSVMGLLAKDRPLVSFTGADLRGVDGRVAPLQGVDLRGADLSFADLRGAYLGGIDLRGALLDSAHMQGAKAIMPEQLRQEAFSAGDAKLPDGQVYQEWRKEYEESQTTRRRELDKELWEKNQDARWEYYRKNSDPE